MTTPIPPQISLRALRKALGLTLEQLAERIQDQDVEISRTGLNNAELGYRRVSEPVKVAWAHALGISPNFIRQGRELRELVTAAGATEQDTHASLETAA